MVLVMNLMVQKREKNQMMTLMIDWKKMIMILLKKILALKWNEEYVLLLFILVNYYIINTYLLETIQKIKTFRR